MDSLRAHGAAARGVRDFPVPRRTAYCDDLPAGHLAEPGRSNRVAGDGSLVLAAAPPTALAPGAVKPPCSRRAAEVHGLHPTGLSHPGTDLLARAGLTHGRDAERLPAQPERLRLG